LFSDNGYNQLLPKSDSKLYFPELITASQAAITLAKAAALTDVT
jgi:hypothetical protein